MFLDTFEVFVRHPSEDDILFACVFHRPALQIQGNVLTAKASAGQSPKRRESQHFLSSEFLLDVQAFRNGSILTE